MSQVVIVTGASSGIGKSTALTYIKNGFTVYAGARRVEKMKDISKAGGTVIKLDVTSQKSIDEFVAEVLKEEDRIDILVNNAGYGLYGSVEDTPIDAVRYQYEVNVIGLAAMTKAVIPTMRKHRNGRIINISSVGGKITTPTGSYYHGTKFAVEGFSDCLRMELSPFNIDVVVIRPGLIATEFTEVLNEKSPNMSEPYSPFTNAFNKQTKEMYDAGKGSHPQVIADLIVKASTTARPKTRYSGGYLAKPILFLRTILPDRWFDKLILSQVKFD